MSRAINEVGKRYGKLIVIEKAGVDKYGQNLWLCQCECGNKTIVRGYLLRSGRTKSCGCLIKKYWIKEGDKYGRLTVIEKAGKDKHNRTLWRCQCKCGNEVVILGFDLGRGNVQSCGCLKKERFTEAMQHVKRWNTLPNGQAALNSLYKNYQRAAKRRGIEFALTKEAFKKLTKQNCYYCGAPPAQTEQRSDLNGSYVYNGLDRKDPSKGYTFENVVPCCGICNIAKQRMDVSEFIEWIGRVYNHSVVNNKREGVGNYE